MKSEAELYFYFSLLVFFSDSRKSDRRISVGISTKSAIRDEGYAWVPKIRDFTENSGKN